MLQSTPESPCMQNYQIWLWTALLAHILCYSPNLHRSTRATCISIYKLMENLDRQVQLGYLWVYLPPSSETAYEFNSLRYYTELLHFRCCMHYMLNNAPSPFCYNNYADIMGLPPSWTYTCSLWSALSNQHSTYYKNILTQTWMSAS